MIRKSFNDGWTVGPNTGFFNMAPGEQPRPVNLPYDAMLMKPRNGNATSGYKKGFFAEGSYDYVKKFFVPEEYKDKRVTFEFEGVYMNAMVYINGDFAGQHPYGYSNFYIKADRFLKYGTENEIKVVAKSNDDSRWYTGTGIYRNTKIMVAEPVHIAADGAKITTPDMDEKRAIVVVATTVENEGMNPVSTRIVTEIIDAEGTVVAVDNAPLTVFAGESAILRQRLYVKQPNLWSVDMPYLYTARSKVVNDTKLLDEESNTFGIRSLSLDAEEGLKINGQVVKLRGTCIHHDNGVIGAATFDRSEERRVEILKEAGFNAIRSAHNPASKALLNACDRLGMLVMDEAFDTWTINKSPYDYALYFPTWWEQDIKAMVDKDFNHPSVIMYSIGNEIPETGSVNGNAWGRKLAEKVRSIDSTRFTTNSVNGFVSVMSQLQAMMQGGTPGGDVNSVMSNITDMMRSLITSDMVTNATEEAFAAVDIAGLNYGDARYEMDKQLFPNRVIVGSETYPKDIANNWKLVKENGHVIGDFTWTGWDYLGESGIGKCEYEGSGAGGVMGNYPWMAAYCGDVNLIGDRRPVSYYREIVFGLRKQPYIAVQRPEHYNDKLISSPWSWSDSISSWTWPGFEGKPIKVEVYSDAAEVELFLNGKSLEKAAVGEENDFKVNFDIVYTPGELKAVTYTNGMETGSMVLSTAGKALELKMDVDRKKLQATGEDLAYVMISLTDEAGILQTSADKRVSINVEGAGVLQEFGSADPRSTENFFDTERRTFDGKVLAVVRSKAEAGTITVTASAEGCSSRTTVIQVC